MTAIVVLRWRSFHFKIFLSVSYTGNTFTLQIKQIKKKAMKMIKPSEDHYIVVDDSEIEEGDWIGFSNLKKFVPIQYLGGDLTGYEKKITHSTQPLEFGWGQEGRDFVSKKVYNKVKPLSLSEVKELLGEVDVEKMAEEALISHPDFKAEGYSDYQNGRFNGIVEGYNKALEDNKERKYTREDLLDAYTWGFLEGTERRDDVTDSVNKFSQSLQPKTEWDVEFSNGKLKLV